MGVWTSYQASHNRFKQPVYKDEQKWQKWRIELTSGLKQPLFRNPQLLRLQVPNHDLVMFFQKFQSIAVPMAQIYLICVANMITIICKHIYYCSLVNYSMSMSYPAWQIKWSEALLFAFKGQSWGKTRSWTYIAHRSPVTNSVYIYSYKPSRHRLDNLTSWKVT